MKRLLALALTLCLLAGLTACGASPQKAYEQAEALMASGKYAEAAAKFEELGAYSDASQMAMYCRAVDAAETQGQFDVAVTAFSQMGDFKDCAKIVARITITFICTPSIPMGNCLPNC